MYQAVKLCGVVDQISVESCGRTSGKSPEHSAARKAVIHLLAVRTMFMNACQTDERFELCLHRSEWLMWGGFNRAMEEEAMAKAVKHD